LGQSPGLVIAMAGSRTVVIAEVGAVRIWLTVGAILALVALILWAAFVHGYDTPRTQGRQYGLRHFLPILLGLAFILLNMRAPVASLLFHRGAAIRIRDGVLFCFSERAAVEKIGRVSFAPAGLFEGVPGAVVFRLAGSRRFKVYTIGLRTSATTIADRLTAQGIKVDRTHLHPPRSRRPDGVPDAR
jgi:hypothetical protein